MADFTQCPVVDNHCHALEPEKKTIEPIWLAREFFHGIADTPVEGVAKSKLWGATDELLFHSGMMAHTFPHVWVDLGWTTPWTSQRIAECYRDVISMAPLSKIMIGSGGHGSPEVSWLAAKTAKIALGEILTDSVRLGLMAEKDAQRAGRMILYDNAAQMYGLKG